MEGNLAENWKEWIQGFELYFTATGIEEKAEKVQCATFLHVASIKARRVYNTFGHEDEDAGKIQVLKTKLKNYYEPHKNLTYIRHVFFTQNQGQDEPIDNYVTDLRNKAQSCEFEHLADGLIRDRIVCGIQDESRRARLLRKSYLTLTKTIDVCRAQEMSTKQLKQLKTSEEQTVAAICKSSSKFKTYVKTDKQRGNNQRSDNTVSKPCCNCARKHKKGECLAFGKVCHDCHKKNHFASCSISRGSKTSKKIHAVGVPAESDSEGELFIGTVHIDTISQDQSDWTETLTINGHKVVFMLDTDAQANIMP